MSDGVRFVDLPCGDCFVHIAYDSEWPFIVMSQLTLYGPRAGLRERIKNAWRSLREQPRPWIETVSRHEAEAIGRCLVEFAGYLPVTASDSTTTTSSFTATSNQEER